MTSPVAFVLNLLPTRTIGFAGWIVSRFLGPLPREFSR